MKTCKNCKYFNACGDKTRTMKCDGFELDSSPYEELIEIFNMSEEEIERMYEVCEPDDEFEDFEDDWDEDDEYVPSATNGDYSPTHPWDAPGMCISDFI